MAKNNKPSTLPGALALGIIIFILISLTPASNISTVAVPVIIAVLYILFVPGLLAGKIPTIGADYYSISAILCVVASAIVALIIYFGSVNKGANVWNMQMIIALTILAISATATYVYGSKVSEHVKQNQND